MNKRPSPRASGRGCNPRALLAALALVAGLMVLLAVPAFADEGGLGISPLLPNAQSPNGQRLSDLYNFISIPAILIFLLVEGLIVTVIIRFRRKALPPDYVPPQTHGNLFLEITWTVIPLLIIGSIVFLSFLELQRDFTKRTDAETNMNITVVGYRYGWQYTYQEDGVQFDSVGQNPTPMVVPVGKLIRIRTQGRDVIHSWWVPYLMGKTDAVPGYDNYTWIQPLQTGTYNGQCAELCGEGHSTMLLQVKVVSQGDYDQWLAQMKAPKQTPKPSASPSASPSAKPSSSPAASPSPSASPS